MQLQETRIYYLSVDGSIQKIVRTHELKYLGTRNNFEFYEVKGVDNSNLLGEICIDKTNNSITYSSTYTTVLQKEITTHARGYSIGQNRFRLTYIKPEMNDASGMILKMIN